MNVVLKKLKSVSLAILPIFLISMVLQLVIYITNKKVFNHVLFFNFVIGSIILLFGLLFLLIGLELSIVKIGQVLGEKIINSRKVLFFLPLIFIIGLFITAAEPDLLIIAKQLSQNTNSLVNAYYLIISISCGVGLLLLVATIRLIFNLELKYCLWVLYLIILSLVIIILFKNNNLLSIAFDVASATTGAIIIPFILSFGIGLANAKKSARDDASFGYVALVSAGSIISSLIYFLSISENHFVLKHTEESIANQIFFPFISNSLEYLKQTSLSIIPFFILFIIINFTLIKLKKNEFIKILKGFIYIFLGLFLFLLSANISYIDFAKILGSQISEWNIFANIFIVFLIGISIVFTESSVYILCKEVSSVTNGAIKQGFVLTFIAIGVALSLVLIYLKNTFFISFSYLILSLYLIAILLLFFIPNLFQGLSFDAGSVASGPISSTFVLALMQGINKNNVSNISSLYGTLAIISIIPVITLELLGLVYYFKIRKRSSYV